MDRQVFALYSQPPAPGSKKFSQAQLLRADRQAFIRLSELFTGSLKAAVVAGKPLDPYVEKIESDMTVTYFMLPVLTSPQCRFNRQVGQGGQGHQAYRSS